MRKDQCPVQSRSACRALLCGRGREHNVRDVGGTAFFWRLESMSEAIDNSSTQRAHANGSKKPRVLCVGAAARRPVSSFRNW